MKKVFGCFSPKGSPKRDQNPSTSTTADADADNSPHFNWVDHWNLIMDAAISDPGPITFSTPAPTPVPGPASAAASTSTNRGKRVKQNDSATASRYSLARIMELTEEAESLSLNLGPEPIQKFTFIELQSATDNFSPDKCVGRGGFGRVYRGNLGPQNQEVAIKRLDVKSKQGTQEFVAELELLSYAKHENIVRLIGYCAENEHRMIVYEYIRLGSLEDHLLNNHKDSRRGVMDWDTRLRIAYEIGKGLEYLHNMEPHKMLYRDLKSANILLGEGFTVKLSDFGCARRVPPDEKKDQLTRVLGTTGYLDPRYFKTGQCTFQTDVYTFGVVLLELVTGRKGLDLKRLPVEDQSLVLWANRVVFNDNATDRFTEIADPLLKGKFDEFTLHSLVAIAKYCIESEPNSRPRMHHIVDVLRLLNKVPDESEIPGFRKLFRNHTFPPASAAHARARLMTF